MGKTGDKRARKVDSITDFVSSVSHDLKNPLASIKGYTQLAKKRLSEAGDRTTARYIDKIEVQSDRAIQLITELLDTKSSAGGKITIRKKPFRLDRLVNETIEDFQVTIGSHKITSESNISIKVEADKERVRRVLFNLLTNAVKYSPNADMVIVRINSDKQNAIVAVQDFGLGIPASKQKNLFDLYFRVKEGGKNYAKGYGLGLPIVRRIIEAHSGKVWFESKIGKGSTFYFSIPLHK